MMKYFIATTLLFFLCSPLLLQAQQHKSCDNILPQYNRPENNVWVMGDSLGLDFNNPTGPVAMASNIYYTGASVADSNGQLLFYTNGMTVWRADGSFMPNGSQLSGGSQNGRLGQPCQIIQVPYQPEQYYLFTIAWDNTLYCNLIDMALSNGMGKVAWSFPLRGVPLTTNNINLAMCIAAVPDCSGNAWVLVHDALAPVFRAFKVTATGIDTIPVVSDFSNILPPSDYVGGNIGNIAVSPNGRLVALSHSSHGFNTNLRQLACYDFDPATGAFSNPRNLKTGGSNDRYIGQAAFSPDNSKLYGMTLEDTNHLFLLQYDLNATVADSLIEPDSFGSINSDLTIGGLRLGPDGKIYFGTQGTQDPVTGKFGYRAIGRINYPNNPGAACGFQDSVASVDFSALPPSATFLGYFPIPVVIPQSSLQISVQLQGDTLLAQPGSYGSYQWYLNGSALANGQDPYLPITDTGLYAVKVTDIACGCTDSVLYHLSEMPGLGISPVATGQIRTYPNPTHDKIFVEAPMPLNLSLYDLTGRLLRQSKGKNDMDITGFADGVYLLRIEDKQGRFVKMEKMVKRNFK